MRGHKGVLSVVRKRNSHRTTPAPAQPSAHAASPTEPARTLKAFLRQLRLPCATSSAPGPMGRTGPNTSRGDRYQQDADHAPGPRRARCSCESCSLPSVGVCGPLQGPARCRLSSAGRRLCDLRPARQTSRPTPRRGRGPEGVAWRPTTVRVRSGSFGPIRRCSHASSAPASAWRRPSAGASSCRTPLAGSRCGGSAATAPVSRSSCGHRRYGSRRGSALASPVRRCGACGASPVQRMRPCAATSPSCPPCSTASTDGSRKGSSVRRSPTRPTFRSRRASGCSLPSKTFALRSRFASGRARDATRPGVPLPGRRRRASHPLEMSLARAARLARAPTGRDLPRA